MEGKRPFRGTLNFSIFQKKSAMEIFNVIFEKGSSKSPPRKHTMNTKILQLSTDSIFMVSGPKEAG